MTVYFLTCMHLTPFSHLTGDYASFCEVDLCEKAGYLLLQQHEELNISTDFLRHGLRFEKVNRGYRLSGPAKVDYMRTALQHIQWYNFHPAGMGGRCFQLHCVAELETIHSDGSVAQLRVKSNPVRSVVRIRHFTSVHSTPMTSDPDYKGRTIFFVSESTYKPIAKRPQAFRVLRDLGPSLYSTDVPPKASSSDSGQSFGYPLLIFAVTLVVVLLTVLSIVVYSKLRSSHRLSGLEPEWEPVNADHVVTTSATKRRKHRGYESRETSSTLTDSLQLIVNPVSHPEEIEEMKNKFCFYDRKIYDGEPIDTLEGVENSSDANEELSDFDGAPDNRASSLTETLLDDRKKAFH
ncbi:unnamed protein product [Dicrocoelium dendriticum]|nr:unnamed protein product [Dicrocoelium dendriticum]